MDVALKQALDAAVLRAKAASKQTAETIAARYGAGADREGVKVIARMASAAGAELGVAEAMVIIEPTREQLRKLVAWMEQQQKQRKEI